MKNLLIGLILGWIIITLAAVVFVKTQGLPLPVKTKPLPFEEMIASISFDHALRGTKNLVPPIDSSEKHLLAGAKIYKANCAFCHSLPLQPEPSFAAKGMFPPPPSLFEKDQGVTEMPIGSTYWLIKNGIRLTGMPGFEDTLSDEKIWQVSYLLKKADDLPKSVKAELKASK